MEDWTISGLPFVKIIGLMRRFVLASGERRVVREDGTSGKGERVEYEAIIAVIWVGSSGMEASVRVCRRAFLVTMSKGS